MNERIRIEPNFAEIESDSEMSPNLIRTVGDLVGSYLDINSVPRMSFFEQFAALADDELEQEKIEKSWAEFEISVPLDIVHSPYRELSGPVLAFVDELDARYENDVVTIVIPEFIVSHWWEHLLHNQSALMLKGRLLFRRDVVVVSVPYHLRRDQHEPA